MKTVIFLVPFFLILSLQLSHAQNSLDNKPTPASVEHSKSKQKSKKSITSISQTRRKANRPSYSRTSYNYNSSKHWSRKAAQHKAVEKIDETVYVNAALIMGAWIPTGDISKLGAHPDLGFQVGRKTKKMSFDFTMIFKFINSPNYFYARRNNSLEQTNHFFGGYIGFDVRRDIYHNGRSEFSALAGIAFDGFDVLNENRNSGLTAVSTNSYNFNFGLGYRYYYTNHSYFGLNVKYNIVDYSMTNVIDFTGNPVTIHFIVGGLWRSCCR